MKMIETKEHYDLMAEFQKVYPRRRSDREPKNLWASGAVYQDGMTNELFKAYRMGYALGRAVERQ